VPDKILYGHVRLSLRIQFLFCGSRFTRNPQKIEARQNIFSEAIALPEILCYTRPRYKRRTRKLLKLFHSGTRAKYLKSQAGNCTHRFKRETFILAMSTWRWLRASFIPAKKNFFASTFSR
jgi:hypothetical protein